MRCCFPGPKLWTCLLGWELHPQGSGELSIRESGTLDIVIIVSTRAQPDTVQYTVSTHPVGVSGGPPGSTLAALEAPERLLAPTWSEN